MEVSASSPNKNEVINNTEKLYNFLTSSICSRIVNILFISVHTLFLQYLLYFLLFFHIIFHPTLFHFLLSCFVHISDIWSSPLSFAYDFDTLLLHLICSVLLFLIWSDLILLSSFWSDIILLELISFSFMMAL